MTSPLMIGDVFANVAGLVTGVLLMMVLIWIMTGQIWYPVIQWRRWRRNDRDCGE